jgi:hypothetical protein
VQRTDPKANASHAEVDKNTCILEIVLSGMLSSIVRMSSLCYESNFF